MPAKRCMIVDDDLEFRDSIHLVLLDTGHDVLAVRNGDEAVLEYPKFSPDIVFMDIRMPGLDGYNAFLQIVRDDPDARVVFMSSYDLNDKKYGYARSIAPVNLIEKPFTIRDINRMIRKHAK